MRVEQWVVDVLDRSTVTGPSLVLPEQLERDQYAKVARVIECAGGKWSRSAKAHVFIGCDAAEVVEQIVLTGAVLDKRQELGQFFTPPALAADLVHRAEIRAGMRVLEPSAGRGAIACAAAEQGGRVDCVEIDRACVDYLDDLDHPPRFHSVHRHDFLSLPPTPKYDRVVMNPPFAMGADLVHVSHAARFLAPGGRIVAVMAAGVLFRQTAVFKVFRALVDKWGGEVTPLPAGSFRQSGTDVSAALLVMDAP